MRLSGTVKIVSKEYAFTRIETAEKIGWYLYDIRREIDGVERAISIFNLEDFNIKGLEPFLVCASEVSTTEYRSFGNLFLLNRINKALSGALLVDYSYVNDELRHTDVTTKGMSKEIDSENPDDLEFGVDAPAKLEELYVYEGKSKDAYLSYEKVSKKTMLGVVGNKINAKNLGKAKARVTKQGLFSRLNFSYDDVTLTTMYTSNTSFNKRKQFDIAWESMETMSTSIAKFTEMNMAVKAKTLSQLRMLKDLSHLFHPNGKFKKNYEVVDTLERLKELADTVFPKIKFWAFDVESTGLNFFTSPTGEGMDHIVSIMFAWKKGHAIFIPIDMINMPNVPKGFWDILRPWLESIPCGGHNIGFDARAVFVETGIKIKIMHDTQILNFNINTRRAKFNNGLKYLEEKYLKIQSLELKDIFGTSKLAGLFRYLPRDLALAYACPDVEAWLELFEILWAKLPITGRKAYNLDMRTLVHIYQADCNGTRINIDLAKQLRDINNRDMKTIQYLIYKYVGQALEEKNYITELAYEMENNNLTDEDAERLVEEFYSSARYKDAKYEFNINSDPKLADVMYNMLEYPKLTFSIKTNKPAVNAGALKELLKAKTDSSTGWLTADVPSAMTELNADAECLISAEKFNTHVYGLPILISEYRLRHKRDTTFYHAVIDKSINGVYYTQSKLASAETFRIINTIQVLQGFLKKLCIPTSKDHWMLVFDFSQIEYRHMGGLAHVKSLVTNLSRFRADFHTECCALLKNIQPWLVTSAMRKQAKSINFAIPYGMGIASIAQSLFDAITEITKIDAAKQYNKWLETFHEIKELLDKFREMALEQGYVENELGRRRYFYDDEIDPDVFNWRSLLDKAKEKAIERAAGNYPIQSGAADLFKIAFCRFRERLEKEGLAEYVLTSALVHDELQNSVSKEVNPYYLYKIIWEECMLTLKGHPRYFAGISIVDNWYEGKDDLFEAPIEFVDYIIKSGKADEKFKYCDDPKTMVLNDIREYMTSVFVKEFKEIGVDCTSNKIDLKHLLENLQDYFVRGKVPLYHKPLEKPNFKAYENDGFIRGMEVMCLSLGYHDTIEFIYPEGYYAGSRAFVSKDSRAFVQEDGTLFTTFIKNVVPEEVHTEMDGFELDSLDLLDMLENDELELSLDTDEGFEYGGPIYFRNDNNYGTPEVFTDKESLIDAGKFESYGLGDAKVFAETHRLIIDIGDTELSQREELEEYINTIAVPEDTFGCREVCIKLYSSMDYTGVYVCLYDLDKINNILGVGNFANS